MLKNDFMEDRMNQAHLSGFWSKWHGQLTAWRGALASDPVTYHRGLREKHLGVLVGKYADALDAARNGNRRAAG